MTELDDEIVPEALSVINEFGTDLVFTIETVTGNDPTTGIVTTTSTTSTVKGTPPYRYDQRYINNDGIKQDDMQTIIAASGLTFVPERAMCVTFNSIVFQIVNVSVIRSGDEIAVYELQLRSS